uniref:UBX domain-containing protein n=1 Tax=Auxenochlorella protothecoides TaxID=3075 RepID=A0A1D1ZPU3_AUXPR
MAGPHDFRARVTELCAFPGRAAGRAGHDTWVLLQPLACRPFLLGRACSLGTQVTGALGMQVRHQCPRCVPGLLCPATMLFPPLPPLPNAPCQVYQGVEEAEVLCGVYRVSKLPCILAIDPATGALMRQWAGFLPPDRLAEELMPFLEHTFLDPGASALAANRRRRAAPSAPAGSLPRAGAASEDAELAAAIAASLEPKAESGLTSAGRAAGAAPAQPSGSDAPPAAAARGEAAAGPIPAAAVAAEAAARLPVETSGPGSCRVAVRCPDGSRLQRRFEQTAPLETLRDLCIASCPEAAAGRPFFLAPSFPGAQPLLDMAADLTTSGAADSMLVMKWAE